ncbi:MAG: tetratricopeptide repeat protein [Candidatus Sumerlaeia bacterium]|nr:tetratricopeptide repeat protein [Candidatus Sumerlaeia bacterium]
MPANRPPSLALPLPVNPLQLLWVLSAATLATLLAYLHAWPQAPYPLNGVAPALGLIILAAAAVLMVARSPDMPARTLATVLFPSGLFLWALWRTSLARVPAEGTSQAGTLLEGLLVFSIALVLSAVGSRFRSFRFRAREESAPADLSKHMRAGGGPPDKILSVGKPPLFLNAAMTYFLALAAAVSLWAIYEYFVRYELQFVEFSLEIKRQGRSLSNLTPREWALLDALRSRRVGARFGNPNVLAGFLAMMAPLAVAAAVVWRDRLLRLAAAVSLGLIWFVVLLSGSRGGMLTLLGATLAGVAVLGRSELQKEFRILSLAGLMCVGAVLAAYYLPSPKPPEQAAGLPAEAMPRARYSFFERLRTAPGIRQRVFYFQSAAAMIRTSPWLGQGLGSYAVLYPRHKHPQAGEARHPHNIVLHLLVETGLVGLILWMAWVAAVVAAGVRQMRAASGAARTMVAALLAALLAYLFNNLMEITWTFRETWLDWCLLAGIIAGYGGSGSRHADVSQAGKPPAAASTLPALHFVALLRRRTGLILASIPLAIGVVFSNAYLLRPLLGEAAELAAGDLLREEPTPQINAEILRLSLKAIRYQPQNPWYRDWLACFYRDTGRFDEAREQFREALRLHPDSAKIRMDFARLEQINKRYDEARRLLTEAVALYPHARYYHLLAAVEREAGNLDAAREHYRAAMAASLDAREAAAIRADFADLERKTGRLDAARRLLQDAIRTYPMNGQYHYLLADLEREGGDLAAARSHIDNALKYASGAEEKVRYQQFRRQLDEAQVGASP